MADPTEAAHRPAESELNASTADVPAAVPPVSVRGAGWIIARTDRLLPVTIVLACSIWLFVVRQFWWYSDDFLYLTQSKAATPDLEFLRVSNYGHFAPITRTAYWVAANPLGLSHSASAAMSVFALGISTMLASLIVKELAPGRPTLRWLVLLPMLTPFLYRVMPWWGASIHVMVGLTWSLLALWCWIRHLRTDRTRWLVGAYVALIGGLLTQERPLFVVAAFFLLEFVTTPGSGPWHVRPYQLRRELRRWMPAVVIVGFTLWNQLTFYPNDLPSPSMSDVATFLYLAATDYFLPGIFGARGGPASWPVLAVRWAVIIVLAVLIADLLRRRTSWWKAPVFFGAMWLVHVGPAGAVKAGVRGPEGVAADPQYYVDAVYLAVFALALALSQPVRSAPLSRPARRRRAIAAGGLVAVMIANVPSMTQSMNKEYSGLLAGQPYWDRARDALRITPEFDGQYLPLRLPYEIAPSFVAPFNEQSEFRRVFLDDERTMNGSPTRLVAVDQNGRLREVAPDLIESGNLGATALAGRTNVSGTLLVQNSSELCFDPAATAGTVDLTLGTPVPAPKWPWNSGTVYDAPTFFAVRYRTAVGGPIQAGSVVDGSLDLISHPLEAPAGTGIAIARLDQDGAATRVFLTGFGGDRVCVSDYAVFRATALPLSAHGPCQLLKLGGELETNTTCPAYRWDPRTIVAREAQ